MAKITVPQAAGEINIAVGGREPTTWAVTDHRVTVDDADVDLFVSQIDGAAVEAEADRPISQVDGTKPASGTPAGAKKES